MKTLRECLNGSYMGQGKGFHSWEHFNTLMTKHRAFHAGDHVYFIRDVFGLGNITIIKVYDRRESTSSDFTYPEIDSNITVGVLSFASAVSHLSGDTRNYKQILDILLPATSKLNTPSPENNHP